MLGLQRYTDDDLNGFKGPPDNQIPGYDPAYTRPCHLVRQENCNRYNSGAGPAQNSRYASKELLTWQGEGNFFEKSAENLEKSPFGVTVLDRTILRRAQGRAMKDIRPGGLRCRRRRSGGCRTRPCPGPTSGRRDSPRPPGRGGCKACSRSRDSHLPPGDDAAACGAP